MAGDRLPPGARTAGAICARGLEQGVNMGIGNRGRMVRVGLGAGSVLAVALLVAATAAAALRAAVSVPTTGGTRIVVTLTSTKHLSARQRPVGVTIRAGGTTFRLTRRAGAGAAAVSAGTFSTAVLHGSAAAKALALRGQHVTVLVRLAHGTVSVGSTVAGGGGVGAPTSPGVGGPGAGSGTGTGTGGGTGTGTGTGTGGGTGSATPLFTPPGQELTGQAAYDSFKRYFVNSEFSDCQGGHWGTPPNYCAVENRYEHGAEISNGYGSFEYRRCTPTAGSDINSTGYYYTIVGAAQHADGSWVVEYTNGYGGFYHWEVGQNGIANGYYSYQGGPPDALNGYYWRQPAYFADCYGTPEP